MVADPNQQAEDQQRLAMTRRLARAIDLIHSVNYYTAEINRFRDDGFRGWWHAYLAYRPAPLGPVPAAVVTAAFFNFAPRMIERAVPGVWDIMSPADVLARRFDLVDEAFERIFADGNHDDAIAEAADLAEAAVRNLDPGVRVLSAAMAAQPWPERPAMRLWHAATIWREYRGDSHNIALAAAEIDGLESHLLMAAHGRGNQRTITGIRGWTEEEWADASGRLQGRGILSADGSYTDAGRAFRSGIEASTDELAARPLSTLGSERAARLQDLLETVTADLLESGAVPGVWPPPTVLKS